MSAQEDRSSPGAFGWPAAAIYLLCAMCVQITASLALWTVVPVAGGMTPTLIVSNSMKPYVSAGDIVMTLPPGKAPLRRGQVITFEDPVFAGRYMTHRIVERNPDGSYDTRGDANGHGDSTPVTAESIRGVGRLVVPAAGIPLLWGRSAQYPPLAAWLAGLGLCLAYLRASNKRTRPAAGDGPPRGKPWLRDPATPLPRPVAAGLSRAATVAWPALVVVVALLVPRTLVSQAAFAATGTNSGNSYAAASSFCAEAGQQVVVAAVANARTEQSSATAVTGTELRVVGRNNNNIESLVKFDLPALGHCSITAATLELTASSVQNGRDVEVSNADRAWTEGDVLWGTRPLPLDGGETTRLAASASMAFNVRQQVLVMYSDANHGFVVRDPVTTTNGNQTGQTYHNRTSATTSARPKLILTLG